MKRNKVKGTYRMQNLSNTNVELQTFPFEQIKAAVAVNLFVYVVSSVSHFWPLQVHPAGKLAKLLTSQRMKGRK